MFRISAVFVREASLRSPATLHFTRSFHGTLLRGASKRSPSAPVASTSANSNTLKKRRLPKKQVEDLTPDNVSATEDVPKRRRKRRTSRKGKEEVYPSVFLRDRDEIVDCLQDVRMGGVKGDGRRVNIVSEKLCDDIIERLKPSLEEHKGCDIIDINPGVGLWSSKLHDVLKPRTHLLMEADASYKPLLRPLLEAESSTYKLIPKAGVVWAHMEKILSKEYLPFQEQPESREAGMSKINKTLLVTGNISYFPKKVYRGFQSLALLLMYQFLGAARANSLFHQYGAVRMLIWVLDEERDTTLPKTIALRQKSAIEAEVTCGKTTEVASTTKILHRWKRDHYLEIRSTRAVLKKMQEAGIKTPKGRESLIALEIAEQGADGSAAFQPATAYLKEMELLEDELAKGKITRYSRGKTASPEFARLQGLRMRRKSEARVGADWVDKLAEYDEVLALQKAVSRKQGDTAALQRELDERTDQLNERISTMSPRAQANFYYFVDNHRTFNLNPPLLQWDRREYEPLRVHPDEFQPQEELCLIDFQPQPLWPILRENFPANYDVFEYIVGSLLSAPTQSVKRGFNALWPGALEWLVAECPSVTDPHRGGLVDLNQFTVRCLTLEMYKEIMEAWMRWPFRPSRYALMVRMGSSSYDPDEEPGERLQM